MWQLLSLIKCSTSLDNTALVSYHTKIYITAFLCALYNYHCYGFIYLILCVSFFGFLCETLGLD